MEVLEEISGLVPFCPPKHHVDWHGIKVRPPQWQTSKVPKPLHNHEFSISQKAPKAVVFPIILLMHVTTFRILGYADNIFLMGRTMGILKEAMVNLRQGRIWDLQW